MKKFLPKELPKESNKEPKNIPKTPEKYYEPSPQELQEIKIIYANSLKDGDIKNTYLNENIFINAFLLRESQSTFDHSKNNDPNNHDPSNDPNNPYKATTQANSQETYTIAPPPPFIHSDPYSKIPKPNRVQKTRIKKAHNSFISMIDGFAKLKNNIDKLGGTKYFAKASEGETETKLIIPTLEILGFKYKAKENFKTHGMQQEIDFLLFPSNYTQERYEEDNNNLNNTIILEAKKFGTPFQTGTATKTPERQLLNYLNTIGIQKGILTDGNVWWLYNVSSKTKHAQIIGINLFPILNGESPLKPNNFYDIFNAENFINGTFDYIQEDNKKQSIELENNLKEIIYGEKSILEILGVKIYTLNKSESAENIYHNALVIMFRLIFMLFYENKYSHYLNKHRSYDNYSIYKFYEDLKKSKANYSDLLNIWQSLDKGDDHHKIPMLNGGLFNETEAPLINNNNLLTNEELQQILHSLVNDKDYKNFTTTQLGNIYEGLLAYEFKIAPHVMSLVKYTEKSKPIYTFADDYNLELLQKEHKNLEIIRPYQRDELYLTSLSNQRKNTASYYTPESLTNFMVKKAIDTQLDLGVKILDLKIIDNACGSGHFLVSALNYLSELCETDEYYNQIQTEFTQEKAQIINNINTLVDNLEDATSLYPNDKQIIKRLLLKKVIYGVDLNKIATEITKISLWIETFIFGTPLSFIEHHIKCGNSLVYTTIADFKAFEEKYFGSDFLGAGLINMQDLEDSYHKISNLNDITSADIEESKKIYEEIDKKLQELNSYLHFLNYIDFSTANKQDLIAHDKIKSSKEEQIKLRKNLLKNYDPLLDESLKKSKNKNHNPYLGEFAAFKQGKNEKYKTFIKNYNPFNIEIEFADTKGFNVVVGNPPWDKSKFTEEEFFAEYQSNYRTLKHNEKLTVREKVLSSHIDVKTLYESQQKFVQEINNYFKIKFPHNRGSGDNNLFQFFLERNLCLLKEKGTMYYLTPSLWIFSDSGINIRKHIFNNFSLKSLFQFQNKEKLFQDVASNYKFCLYQIDNAGKTNNFNCFFLETNENRLLEEKKYTSLSLEEIKKYSPNELSIVEINSSLTKNIIFKTYKNFETIKDTYIKFGNELHMTKHKNIMQQTKKDGFIPMHEGKTVEQFNSKHKTITYFVNPNDLPNKKNYTHNRLVFRNIARNTDQRTLISSLIPKNSTFGHSLTATCENIESTHARLLFTQAIFNSTIADFIMRLYVDMNVNLTYLKRLPLPQPSDAEIQQSETYSQLVYNSAMLTYLHNKEDFREFIDEFKLDLTKIPKTETTKKRYINELKVENDTLILSLYNITEEELDYILSTFTALQNKQPEYIALLKERFQEKLKKS